MVYLQAFLELFRFIKHYRERQEVKRLNADAERAREREHQRLMMEGVAKHIADMLKVSQEGMLELAKAQAAQAEVFSSWLKSFQTSSIPEPSSVVREEDEWLAEQKELHSDNPEAFLAQLPAEFRLAYALNKFEDAPEGSDPNPGFDREGSDFPIPKSS